MKRLDVELVADMGEAMLDDVSCGCGVVLDVLVGGALFLQERMPDILDVVDV